jgi:hypothetical protein
MSSHTLHPSVSLNWPAPFLPTSSAMDESPVSCISVLRRRLLQATKSSVVGVGGDRLHKSIDEQRSEYPTLATVMHPRDPYPMEAA